MSSETTPRFQTLCLSTTKSSSLVTTPFYLIASTITRHTLSPFHQTFFLIKHCSFSKGAVLVTVEVFDTVLCSLFFWLGRRGGVGGGGVGVLIKFWNYDLTLCPFLWEEEVPFEWELIGWRANFANGVNMM